jgi:NTP pyrophosphatase (non-canonical NTP hydrolase)
MMEKLRQFQQNLDEIWRVHVEHPKNWDVGSDFDTLILATGLGGECGELLNLIKKRVRGEDIREDRLREELGDCLAYLYMLSKVLNIDFKQSVEYILPKVHEKFPT